MLTQPPKKGPIKKLIYSKGRMITGWSYTLCTTQYLPQKLNHALMSKQYENDNDEFTSRTLWRTQEAEKVRLPISRPRAPGCKDRSFHTKLINNKAIITTIINNHLTLHKSWPPRRKSIKSRSNILTTSIIQHSTYNIQIKHTTSNIQIKHPTSNIQHPNQTSNIQYPTSKSNIQHPN